MRWCGNFFVPHRTAPHHFGPKTAAPHPHRTGGSYTRYWYQPISAIFANIGIGRYIGIFADIGIGRYISIFGRFCTLLIPSQQLYFCCSPWWKSNLQSWFAIILLQLVLQLMYRGFFQLMVMLSHQREIIYYPKMHKKSCTCMKICHF